MLLLPVIPEAGVVVHVGPVTFAEFLPIVRSLASLEDASRTAENTTPSEYCCVLPHFDSIGIVAIFPDHVAEFCCKVRVSVTPCGLAVIVNTPLFHEVPICVVPPPPPETSTSISEKPIYPVPARYVPFSVILFAPVLFSRKLATLIEISPTSTVVSPPSIVAFNDNVPIVPFHNCCDIGTADTRLVYLLTP